MVPSSGLELLLDLRECKASVLDDPSALEKILLETASAAGFEVVSRTAHQFNHQGVTLVLILSQSHLALHTWPEERFAAVDVYVCGERETVSRALEIIREKLIAQFDARSASHRLIERSGTEPDFLRTS